jgi:hypothetical protein
VVFELAAATALTIEINKYHYPLLSPAPSVYIPLVWNSVPSFLEGDRMMRAHAMTNNGNFTGFYLSKNANLMLP